MATAGLEGNSYQLLLRSIPYNFFIFVCLVMVYCVAAFNLNIGPMARAEKRAATTGKLLEHSFSGDSDEEASYDELEPAKGKPVDLIFPITLLICLVLFFMLYTGGFFTHYDLMQTVSQMEGIRSLMYGLVFTIIITAIYLRIRNTAPFTELASAAFVGIKSILYANLVLILGWTLGGVSESLGITQFLISVFQGNIPPVFTPAILFLLWRSHGVRHRWRMDDFCHHDTCSRTVRSSYGCRHAPVHLSHNRRGRDGRHMLTAG